MEREGLRAVAPPFFSERELFLWSLNLFLMNIHFFSIVRSILQERPENVREFASSEFLNNCLYYIVKFTPLLSEYIGLRD